ncbi:MAG TPA: nickel-responsive transcriptional regulator NikR [bacterium]|nr:nickel-responsive transcriptional regulator NikR [bacterium]
MEKVTRFGVSVPHDLLKKFDSYIKSKKYSNRSEAIRDLIRNSLSSEEWRDGSNEVMGSINLVYDHHTRELSEKIGDLQHNYFKNIVSTTHIHLDAHNCLEVVIVRGKSSVIRELSDMLTSMKGVKLGKLSLLNTGKDL